MADQNRPRVKNENLVWSTGLLEWVAMQQPTLEADSVTVELPNEGQQTMANSISVALASNQSNVPALMKYTDAITGVQNWDGTLSFLVGSYPDFTNVRSQINNTHAIPAWTKDTALDIALQGGGLLSASGTASSSGANLIIAAPTAPFHIRLSYLSYNPDSPVTAAFSFGAAGTEFLKNKLQGSGSIVAKDFGDFKSLEGGEAVGLYLRLSAAVPTQWNVFYNLRQEQTFIDP